MYTANIAFFIHWPEQKYICKKDEHKFGTENLELKLLQNVAKGLCYEHCPVYYELKLPISKTSRWALHLNIFVFFEVACTK